MTADHAIVWEAPPTEREVVSYSWFYQRLREKGQWARYPGTQSAASQWCEKHPEYEYTSKMVDGQRRVWMRYVGTD